MSLRNNTWRTKPSNHPLYRKMYQGKRRAEQKSKAVNYKGSVCEKCGYSFECLEVYDFHHPDPTQKEIKIADWMGRSKWDKLKKELDKCVLLCANCHRIHHAELREAEYETYS
jgi:predicted Zn-ribbon and HTH transcriptional regulator